jgi:hypothetical protein
MSAAGPDSSGVKFRQVVGVLGLMLISGVEAALLMRRQAADLAPFQRPLGEGIGRVVEMRASQASLTTVTIDVELHRVRINPLIARCAQLNPHRSPVRFDGIPEAAELLKARLEVVRINGEIKVAVLPALQASKDGNPPSRHRPSSGPGAHPAHPVPWQRLQKALTAR